MTVSRSKVRTLSPARRKLSAAARPRLAHIWTREVHDHYVEPQWCSTRLFEVEDFGAPGATIYDPCCGWGRILQAADAAGFTPVGADIVDRRRGLDASIAFYKRDFLKPTRHVPWWSMVCNPPFDHIKEFCELAVERAIYKVAMIIPLKGLPAAHWLKRLPLETIYLLTPRPSMPTGAHIDGGGYVGGDTKDYVWLVFNKRDTVASPRLRWLHRDGEIEEEEVQCP
jgi:hypothetical protein